MEKISFLIPDGSTHRQTLPGVLRRVRTPARGGTALTIPVQMADRISVPGAGRITGQGSDAELMQINGRYAFLFRTQAEHCQP